MTRELKLLDKMNAVRSRIYDSLPGIQCRIDSSRNLVIFEFGLARAQITCAELDAGDVETIARRIVEAWSPPAVF